jgi:hypothetical protein
MHAIKVKAMVFYSRPEAPGQMCDWSSMLVLLLYCGGSSKPVISRHETPLRTCTSNMKYVSQETNFLYNFPFENGGSILFRNVSIQFQDYIYGVTARNITI